MTTHRGQLEGANRRTAGGNTMSGAQPRHQLTCARAPRLTQICALLVYETTRPPR